MLPNLNALNALALSVENKRGADEAGLNQTDNVFSNSIPKLEVIRMPLQDVDWKNLLNRLYYGSTDDDDLQASITFAVYVPRPGARQWKIKFEIDEYKLKIESSETSTPCMVAYVRPFDDDNIFIDSLFHALDDETRNSCNIKPNIVEEASSGIGGVVLQILDVILAVRGGSQSLADASEFRFDSVKPSVSAGSLTQTLSLLRGFGYYEARGFIPEPLVQMESDKTLYAAATMVDLEWTHMVCTTPVNKLVHAIACFYERVEEMNKVNKVPKFTRNLYSRLFCEQRAQHASTTFIAEFQRAANVRAACPERLGVLSYSELSMRSLANATMSGIIAKEVWDNDDFSDLLKLLFKEVWLRPLPITQGRPVQIYYGDTTLTKVLFTDSNGNASYNSVVASPTPGNVPVVRLQSVRTDITVEFNERDNVKSLR